MCYTGRSQEKKRIRPVLLKIASLYFKSHYQKDIIMETWKKNYLKFVAATALQAGIFVAYRLWIDKKNKSEKARVDAVELTLFKPEMPRLFVELDLNQQFEAQGQLNLQKSTSADSPDTLYIQPLMYRRVLVSVQKYQETRRGLYGVYVDLAGLRRENLEPQEFLSGFLKDFALDRVPEAQSHMTAVEEEFFKYVVLADFPEDRDLTEDEQTQVAEAEDSFLSLIEPIVNVATEIAAAATNVVEALKVPTKKTQEAMDEARELVGRRTKQKLSKKKNVEPKAPEELEQNASSKLQVAKGTTPNETPLEEVQDLTAVDELDELNRAGF